jgi:hypothetical protein
MDQRTDPPELDSDPELDGVAALRLESDAFTARLLAQTASLRPGPRQTATLPRPRCTCRCTCGAKQRRAEEMYASARRVSDAFHRAHQESPSHQESALRPEAVGLGVALAGRPAHVVVASGVRQPPDRQESNREELGGPISKPRLKRLVLAAKNPLRRVS